MYNIIVKTISTTEARKTISDLVNHVRETGEAFAIGRHNKPEVLVIKFPTAYNTAFNEIANINAQSESFSFLEDEPDLYSVNDLKRRYV